MPANPFSLNYMQGIARSEREGVEMQTGMTLMRNFSIDRSIDNEPTFGTILCSGILLHLSAAGRQVILCRKLFLDESNDVLD
jgi:hypothetical protein